VIRKVYLRLWSEDRSSCSAIMQAPEFDARQSRLSQDLSTSVGTALCRRQSWKPWARLDTSVTPDLPGGGPIHWLARDPAHARCARIPAKMWRADAARLGVTS
jgi:hypothetical protein